MYMMHINIKDTNMYNGNKYSHTTNNNANNDDNENDDKRSSSNELKQK